MIVREFYKTRNDGINLYKTYSDANVYIRKVDTKEIYDIAIDVEGAAFAYVETENLIEISKEVEVGE